MLICPVCKNIITKFEKAYKCENNHCFDLHKSGYVNLLLANRMNSKAPGDNKIMVEARRSFLSNGYYNCLLLALNKTIDEINPQTILDSGCGEGYYTNYINKENRRIFGIDISKTAVGYAAKSNSLVDYFVGSVFDIPIMNNSIDLVMSLFAPYSGAEFLRVLKPDGHLVMVIPGRDHLIELKNTIYENPYENDVKDYKLDGFSYDNSTEIKEKIIVNNKADIDNLFKMTPYYYRTKKEDYEKILQLETLEITLNFEILVYSVYKNKE